MAPDVRQSADIEANRRDIEAVSSLEETSRTREQ
jgi:hypothetical protein